MDVVPCTVDEDNWFHQQSACGIFLGNTVVTTYFVMMLK